MRIVLILSAVSIAIVALRIFFALRTAHSGKTPREEGTIPANTGGPVSSADPARRPCCRAAILSR
jgi:hypothetical protein